jgi:chaperonin cofactor prefoldin
MKLNGVSYNWRSDEYKERGFSDRSQIGLIAQDVEETFPELVHTDTEGYKAVAYSKLTAVLVEAVKELKAENEALKSQNDKIKKVTKDQQSQIDELRALITALGG